MAHKNYKRSGFRVFLFDNEDGTYSEFAKDSMTNAVATINEGHAKIHSGDFYHVPNVLVSVASGATYSLAISTTATNIHYRHERMACSGDKLTIQLFEDATFTGGTTQTVMNSNRQSANTSNVVVKIGVSASALNTIIDSNYIGGGTNVGGHAYGGENETDTEILFKINTNYVLMITNGSSNVNTVNINPTWYEID